SALPFLFFYLHFPPPPRSTLFPYTTLFRSRACRSSSSPARAYSPTQAPRRRRRSDRPLFSSFIRLVTQTSSVAMPEKRAATRASDRKSTRLNSSHVAISYAVFCLKKKNNT